MMATVTLYALAATSAASLALLIWFGLDCARRDREAARRRDELQRLWRESLSEPLRIVDRDGRLTYAGWYYHRDELGDYAAFDASECVGVVEHGPHLMLLYHIEDDDD